MEEPDYKTIGINIKIKRIRQGISQAKLAKLLGVSAAHLCNIAVSYTHLRAHET